MGLLVILISGLWVRGSLALLVEPHSALGATMESLVFSGTIAACFDHKSERLSTETKAPRTQTKYKQHEKENKTKHTSFTRHFND